MFYSLVRILLGSIVRIFYPIELINGEKIPEEGGLIISANHASNFDPIFISIGVKRQISWMAKNQLFKSKILGFLLGKLGTFPVDRDGSDIGAIRNSLRVIKEGRVLGIFPEGTRVKSFDLDNAKAGLALLAIKTKASIVPIYIDSSYRMFSKSRLYVGDQIDLSASIQGKASTEDYLNLSREVLNEIYQLKTREESI